MEILCTVLLFLAVIRNPAESSRRQGNDWSPPSPESTEGFNVHEITGLLNDMVSHENSCSDDFGENTSVHPIPAEHISHDEQHMPRPLYQSSQSARSPDDAQRPGYHRFGAPPLAGETTPDTTHSLASPYHSAESSASANTPLRIRSRSPTLRQTFASVLDYRFEDLPFIRLIPHNHPNRIYGLRKYVFPADKQIGLKTKHNVLLAMSTDEQLVLSTSHGDVCAILQKTSGRHTILRGIFTSILGPTARAKININSGAVEKLTSQEITECPVTSFGRPIRMNYRVFLSGSSSQLTHPPADDPNLSLDNSGSSTHSARSAAESQRRDRSRSPTARETFPSVLGHRFEDVASIRLIPHTNPHRIFELRKYVFPIDKPIRIMTKNHALETIPTGEQIVLSTADGDVCAILGKTLSKHTIFRPIFIPSSERFVRAKINVYSGTVEELTAEEIAECPVSTKNPITKNYTVSRV